VVLNKVKPRDAGFDDGYSHATARAGPDRADAGPGQLASNGNGRARAELPRPSEFR
jgi:hypothetical protein